VLFSQVPAETGMKQYPFPRENVVKQIAGINALDQQGGRFINRSHKWRGSLEMY
jgi:hypothetical protein